MNGEVLVSMVASNNDLTLQKERCGAGRHAMGGTKLSKGVGSLSAPLYNQRGTQDSESCESLPLLITRRVSIHVRVPIREMTLSSDDRVAMRCLTYRQRQIDWTTPSRKPETTGVPSGVCKTLLRPLLRANRLIYK